MNFFLLIYVLCLMFDRRKLKDYDKESCIIFNFLRDELGNDQYNELMDKYFKKIIDN